MGSSISGKMEADKKQKQNKKTQNKSQKKNVPKKQKQNKKTQNKSQKKIVDDKKQNQNKNNRFMTWTPSAISHGLIEVEDRIPVPPPHACAPDQARPSPRSPDGFGIEYFQPEEEDGGDAPLPGGRRRRSTVDKAPKLVVKPAEGNGMLYSIIGM